jgi:hypothetical protein
MLPVMFLSRMIENKNRTSQCNKAQLALSHSEVLNDDLKRFVIDVLLATSPVPYRSSLRDEGNRQLLFDYAIITIRHVALSAPKRVGV